MVKAGRPCVATHKLCCDIEIVLRQGGMTDFLQFSIATEIVRPRVVTGLGDGATEARGDRAP